MKKFLLLLVPLLISFFISCKKNTATQNTNEIKATVVIASGNIVKIDAAATKVKLGCSLLGGGTFIEGTTPANAAIYLVIYTSAFQCITNPGTYTLSCEYRQNVLNNNAAIYRSDGYKPGSIIFTVVNEHAMEGSFNAVCRCASSGCVFGVDSVVVSGTFKGNTLM